MTAEEARLARSPVAAADAPLLPLQTSSLPVAVFGCIGAATLVFAGYLYASWIFSSQFRPVDPGPDSIPQLDLIKLYALQGVAVCGCLWFLWSEAISPKIKTGRFTSHGLLVLALPLAWWSDPLMNYHQNMWVYNAHLFNMGSWAGEAIPGWLAPHGEKFPEPLVTGMAWLFWFYGGIKGGAAFLNVVRRRWRSVTLLQLVGVCFAFAFVFDLIAEMISVRMGWYAIPGATRPALDAGTLYQIPLTEPFAAGLQTTGLILLGYFRSGDGRLLVEGGAESLNIAESGKTFVRFLAIFGAVNVCAALYFVTIQWEAMRTERWIDGLPSYMTTTCPEYRSDASKCGRSHLLTD